MAEHNELGKLGEELAVEFLRKDGYEIRAATTAADKAIFTTIAQLSAAIGSFEEVIAGPFAVKSLQDHAIDRAVALAN